MNKEKIKNLKKGFLGNLITMNNTGKIGNNNKKSIDMNTVNKLIANQILKANMKNRKGQMAPYDGMVVRRKVNVGNDSTSWKNKKEEVTRYFYELVEAEDRNLEESLSSDSSEDMEPRKGKKIQFLDVVKKKANLRRKKSRNMSIIGGENSRFEEDKSMAPIKPKHVIGDEKSLFDISIFQHSPSSLKYSRSKKKVEERTMNDRLYTITVKELVERRNTQESAKNGSILQQNQVNAYLGSHESKIALNAKKEIFFTKVVEECRTLSRTIHHLYLHLGSNYRKVSHFIQVIIHDISTDPNLIKQILLGDQNLAMDITFLTPQYLFDSLFLGTGKGKNFKEMYEEQVDKQKKEKLQAVT
jgi:hypothetical protein